MQLYHFRHNILLSGGGKPFREDISNFYASLTRGLQNLEQCVETDFMGFLFLGQLIALARSIHADLVILVEKFRLPAITKDVGWLNEYMDETLKILDVCNVLKVGISNLEQYQMLVEILIRCLDEKGYGNLTYLCHHGMQALEACHQETLTVETENKILIDTKIDVEKKLSVCLIDKHVNNKVLKWNGFGGVMFATKNTSSYICRLLLSVLVYPISTPRLKVEGCSLKTPWCVALLKLQQRVSKEFVKKKKSGEEIVVLSPEVQALRYTIADLQVQIQLLPKTSVKDGDDNKLKETVELLVQKSKALQSGLKEVDWQVSNLFTSTVERRNRILNLFSSPDMETLNRSIPLTSK